MHLELSDRERELLARGRALGEGLPPDPDPGLADATLVAARDQGLDLLTVPADRGGAGLSLFDACLVLEGLAGARPSAALILAAHALLAGAVAAAGVEPAYLDALAAGRVGAFALTEPGGGPGLTAPETVAVLDGDLFRLTGEKAYVTNGGAGALVLVAARLDREDDPALFVVKGDAVGVEWRTRVGAVGLLGVRIADLVLHDVTATGRIGGEGEGAARIEAALLADRTAIAAQAVGVAAAAFTDTLRSIADKQAFGALSRSGTVQAQVADMAAALDGARLLWWQAAIALDRGENARELTAMAKLHAARAASKVTDGCLQLLGGAGCFDGADAARRVGDARLAAIRGGSDELMRAIAAKEFLRRLEVAGMMT